MLGPTMDLTCFEVMTLLAWEAFRAAARVDVVVSKVGLGGRLDATNLVTPEVAVITNVAVDHEAYLGRDRRDDRARESGHHQGRRPAWSRGRPATPRDVIAARAAALASPLEVLDRDFALAPAGSGRSPIARRAGRSRRSRSRSPAHINVGTRRSPIARSSSCPTLTPPAARDRRRPRRRTLAGAPPGSVPRTPRAIGWRPQCGGDRGVGRGASARVPPDAACGYCSA